MKNILYYGILFLQLFGFILVGLCLFQGLLSGDYSRRELTQFIAGIILFYAGHVLRKRSFPSA
jgi:hypothetical protein